MNNCRCNSLGGPGGNASTIHPAFHGIGIAGRMPRIQAVGDLWSSVGSVLSGLGTIAGSVIPVVLGSSNTAGGGGSTMVVANPNPTQTQPQTQAPADNSKLLLYGGMGLLAAVVLLRRRK